MTDDTRAAAARGAGTAAGQQISDTFTGSAGASQALKPKGPQGTPGPKATVKGIQAAAIPAFVAGQELADLGETDPRIVVLTADLAGAGRTADFRDRHPDRFFNMGVAEQNMISVAAGMAASGLRPYLSTFAAYVALLGCEQIRTDLAYPGLPVRILAHHSGMSLGYYGTSHHSLEDLSRDAGHRGPDRGLRRRREPAARDPAGLAGPGRAAVHPAGPRPGPRGVPGGARRLRVRPRRPAHRGPRPDPDHHRLAGAALPGRGRAAGGAGRPGGPGRGHAHDQPHQRGRGDRRGHARPPR